MPEARTRRPNTRAPESVPLDPAQRRKTWNDSFLIRAWQRGFWILLPSGKRIQSPGTSIPVRRRTAAKGLTGFKTPERSSRSGGFQAAFFPAACWLNRLSLYGRKLHRLSPSGQGKGGELLPCRVLISSLCLPNSPGSKEGGKPFPLPRPDWLPAVQASGKDGRDDRIGQLPRKRSPWNENLRR